MKVIAVSASPKMEKGNTSAILLPFLEGIKEAGGEVELFYTKQLQIHPCQGDFACWLKTPGTCFQKDDMITLLPKFAAADLWVLATPVYVDGMPGPLKNLIDRLVPMVLPFFELREGHCRHPVRKGGQKGKLVLVSSCGFWEMDNFDPLLVHVKAICRNLNKEFSGALLRPHAGSLKLMIKKGDSVNDIFDAARLAGRQIIQDDAISVQTLATISRALLPLARFVEAFNGEFHKILEKSP